MAATQDGIKAKGFFRIQLGEDGKVVGDSGWTENTITEDGFDNYIVGAMGAIAGSKQVSNMQLATQATAVNSTHTSLTGETGARKTTSNSLVGNGTMQATASWASGDHPGGTPALGSAALYNTSSGGTMACGQTFATSTWNSNQAVSATYQVRFS